MDNTYNFNLIYFTYKEKVLRHVAMMLKKSDIDDIVQEIFIKIEKGLPSFRADSKLSTWIHRITVNHCIDHLRKIKANRIIENHRNDNDDLFKSGNHPDFTEADIIKKEMNNCIKGYILKLPPIYRDVILLSDIEEYSNNEVADKLGISINTAKIRIHRGRQKLKNILTQQCCLYFTENNELACDRKN